MKSISLTLILALCVGLALAQNENTSLNRVVNKHRKPLENPAIPGSTYTGTSDPDVFEMLIFSCFKYSNKAYLKSMYVAKIDPTSIPEGGHTPIIPVSSFDLNEMPLAKITKVKNPKIHSNYIYPNIGDGTELLQFEAKMPESKTGSSTSKWTYRFTASLVNGNYYLLRPIYLENKDEDDAQ